MLRAVVFDLDDTLYSERDYVISGFRAVASWAAGHFGVHAGRTRAELIALFDGAGRYDTFDRWAARHGFDREDAVARMLEVYRTHIPQISPHPEAEAILHRLGATLRLGLLSDGPLEVQRRKLRVLGIAGRFDQILFTDELGRAMWKPSPVGFRTLLERLEVDGCDAAYVADNPSKDFIGARDVGMGTIRVRSRNGLYRHVEAPSPDHAPDLEVEDLTQVEAALDRVALRAPSDARSRA
jgi:putative hydrolase of the HAD superfamily